MGGPTGLSPSGRNLSHRDVHRTVDPLLLRGEANRLDNLDLEWFDDCWHGCCRLAAAHKARNIRLADVRLAGRDVVQLAGAHPVFEVAYQLEQVVERVDIEEQ